MIIESILCQSTIIENIIYKFSQNILQKINIYIESINVQIWVLGLPHTSWWCMLINVQHLTHHKTFYISFVPPLWKIISITIGWSSKRRNFNLCGSKNAFFIQYFAHFLVFSLTSIDGDIWGTFNYFLVPFTFHLLLYNINSILGINH